MMSRPSIGPLLAWLVGLAAVGGLLATSTRPLLQEVADAGAGPDSVVAAGAALAAWAVLAWLGMALAGCLAEAVGLPLARLAAGTAPAALRTAVRTSVGASVVAGTLLTTGVAQASPLPATPDHVVRTVDDQVPWPSLDRPVADPDPHRPDPPAPRTYRVVAGDTLWDIARAHLPGRPSPADVAAAWPGWWRANREVIGDDPDLIRPGQLLRVPGVGS